MGATTCRENPQKIGFAETGYTILILAIAALLRHQLLIRPPPVRPMAIDPVS